MANKFEKDRSVSRNWEKIPLAYPGIPNPQNLKKELVLMEFFGKHYSAAWRNNERCSIGPTFLVKSEVRGNKMGFIFKDKWHPVAGIVL